MPLAPLRPRGVSWPLAIAFAVAHTWVVTAVPILIATLYRRRSEGSRVSGALVCALSSLVGFWWWIWIQQSLLDRGGTVSLNFVRGESAQHCSCAVGSVSYVGGVCSRVVLVYWCVFVFGHHHSAEASSGPAESYGTN